LLSSVFKLAPKVIKELDKISRIIKITLGSIASFSLLVGGIGIMNMMLGPSLIGWVYWGSLMHIAREKIMVAVNKSQTPQSLGNSEYVVLRDLSAFENLMERFNACSTEREDADDLANRIAAGPITQAHAPSPMFAKLTQRLATTGIRIDFAEEKLTFRFERPQERLNTHRSVCSLLHSLLHIRG